LYILNKINGLERLYETLNGGIHNVLRNKKANELTALQKLFFRRDRFDFGQETFLDPSQCK
jgi:hypothetical protein